MCYTYKPKCMRRLCIAALISMPHTYVMYDIHVHSVCIYNTYVILYLTMYYIDYINNITFSIIYRSFR